MEIKCFHHLEMWSRIKELYPKLNIFTCNLYLVGSFLCLIFSNCWPCLPKEQAAEYSSQKQVHSNFHFRILSHKLSFFLCLCFCCLICQCQKWTMPLYFSASIVCWITLLFCKLFEVPFENCLYWEHFPLLCCIRIIMMVHLPLHNNFGTLWGLLTLIIWSFSHFKYFLGSEKVTQITNVRC